MKSLVFRCQPLVVAPFCALLLAGGGGSKPNPNTSGPAIVDNALSRDDFRDTDDDRYYDIFVCDVTKTGTAAVEMGSDEVDASLYIYRKNSKGEFDLIAENDDISAENVNARVEFSVARGKSYRIIATSAQSEERGDYSLYFSEILGRPARVLPDANRVAQSFRLPAMPKKSAKKIAK